MCLIAEKIKRKSHINLLPFVFGSQENYKEKPHLLHKETQKNPVTLTQPHRPRSWQTYSISQFMYFSLFFTPLLSTSTHHWQQEYQRQSGEIYIGLILGQVGSGLLWPKTRLDRNQVWLPKTRLNPKNRVYNQVGFSSHGSSLGLDFFFFLTLL